MDRLFHDFAGGAWPTASAGASLVKMDVAETDDGVELTAELPGLEQKDVKVTLSGNRLTISGEKQAETRTKDKDFHLVERTYGSFSRSVQLPPDIAVDQVEAKLSNGVLKVTAPRVAKPEARTIEVKPAA